MENSKAICPPQQEGTKKRFCIVNRGETTMLCIQAHCSKSSFFVQKFNFDFPVKVVDFFLGGKTRENVVVFDFLAVGNFDFTRFHEKNCQKNLGEKLVKMFGFCQN